MAYPDEDSVNVQIYSAEMKYEERIIWASRIAKDLFGKVYDLFCVNIHIVY